MIAGGTGITPMLQIIRAIIRGREAGDRTEVDLIFANVNKEDILLKEDLDELAAKDRGIRVHYVLNNPPEKWDGDVGFVTADMITVSCLSPQWDYEKRLLTILIEILPEASQRCQDPSLWSTSYDQCYEESNRRTWFQQGQACQQIGGSSLCFLEGWISHVVTAKRGLGKKGRRVLGSGFWTPASFDLVYKHFAA